MAITFPRDLPEPLPFRAATFEPYYTQVRAPTFGGLTQVVNVGPDLWRMRYETPPLDEKIAKLWKAWLHSLRGGAMLFKAWDPTCRYVQAHPGGYGGLKRHGGDDFDGTCNLKSIGATRDTVELETLPTSFVLTAGDMLSFPIGASGQTLHRVVEGGTAALGVVTVTVEPTVPLGAAADVTVSLVKPWCKAVLDAGSVSAPWELGRKAKLSFAAMQVF